MVLITDILIIVLICFLPFSKKKKEDKVNEIEILLNMDWHYKD